MRELVDLLNRARRAYEQEDQEIMSNYEYDRLYDELEGLEKELGTRLASSPTVNVGYEVLSELPKERHERPMLSLDKTKEVERLKEFMRLRLEWLDEQFASVETLRASLGGYVVSDQIWVEQIDTGAQEGRTRVEIRSDAPEGRSVSLQVNGLWFYEAGLSDGKAEFWIEDQALRADGGVNTAQARLLNEEGDYLLNPRGTVEGEYANAASAYACFTKEF